MVGEACLPSNAYYPRTPDYTLCSGVHVCWSEHSDSSFVYGFMSLDYGFGTMTATTFFSCSVFSTFPSGSYTIYKTYLKLVYFTFSLSISHFWCLDLLKFFLRYISLIQNLIISTICSHHTLFPSFLITNQNIHFSHYAFFHSHSAPATFKRQ